MLRLPELTPPAPRVVELFAGVGGFRLGLQESGWETVWANQWEPATKSQPAFECYVDHFGERGAVNEDIHAVLDEVEAGRRDIPNHDLLVGGFPCQDYSVAKTLNQAMGLSGKKGVLWWEIHRLLTRMGPRMLFLENVDRLIKSPADQRGRDFAVMLATLANLNYEVEWRVINAASYGFPQKRRRVLIVGRKAGDSPSDPNSVVYGGALARAFPVADGPVLSSIETFRIDGTPADVTEIFPTTRGETPFRNAGYMSHRRVWTLDLTADFQGPRTTLGDVLEPVAAVPESYFIPESQLATWAYLKGGKRERRHHKATGTPYFYAEGAIPFPDRTDGPSRTILTAEGGSTPSRFKHIIKTDDGRYRRLTPRELERLNGFPDDWTATGMPDGRRAFMMGNALVVGLIERVGRELMQELRRTSDRIAVPVEVAQTVAS